MTAVGTPVTAGGRRRRRSPARRRYSAEISLPGMTYLAIVGATVPSGRVTAIDADAARAAEGVLAVLTHEDLPKIAAEPHLLPSLVGGPAPGESFFPMQDDVVHYAGQPVALVVAEEYEQAQYAASLVRVSYATGPSVTTIDLGRDQAYEADRLFGGLLPGRNERGDVEAGLAQRGPAGRGRLPHGGQPPQPARGAVDGRRLGGRQADALRVDPGHPGHPADGGPAARPADRRTSG